MNNPVMTDKAGSGLQSLCSRACRRMALGLLMLTAAGLSGCFDSVPTQSLPDTNAPEAAEYSGPAPATADVQAFKLNVWDNLVGDNRCGSCHGAGGQSPTFVDETDVNLAYREAITVADLSSPADSRLVSKVGGGHNCWETSNGACAAVMTAYIESWAGGSATGEGKQIELKAPTIKDAGSTKNPPADSSLFASTVYPLLTTHCSGCHVETSATPQAPYFATTDVDAAYEAAKQKIDLDTPANSRFVVRLRDEFHNCWSGDCQSDAQDMENAVTSFAGQVTPTQVDPQLVTSKALGLTDGIVASGGTRYENNVIALWEFKTGSGNTAYDTSGVEPALNLSLTGDIEWVGGYGIKVNAGRAQGPTSDSKKLADFIKSTGEYSIEAWVVPANVTQEGPARIISYSAGTDSRNFTLGQTLYNYNFLHRSTTTDANGEPALSTADADEDLQATLQHVVITFDPVQGRKIFVNGEFTGDNDNVTAGLLNDWNDSYAFVLGNEVSGDRQWEGKLRLVAVHNRALTPDQIKQNFDAGVGEKYYLLFSVSHLVNVPEAYVYFQVSQFDSHSYLFTDPTFVSLDSSAQPDNITVQGMRIGINGKEAKVGQAYVNMDTTVTSGQYTETGQRLSQLGTVIANEKGPEQDEFFLTFERLGSNTHVYTEPAPLQPPPPADSDPVSDIGLRTFEEINATFAAITGVDPTTPAIGGANGTFTLYKQQLPTVENLGGFLPSHQMAVAQLAMTYCDRLVETDAMLAPSSGSRFFAGFDFTDSTSPFDQTGKDQVIDPLLVGVMHVRPDKVDDANDLATQAAESTTRGEMESLIDGLCANSSCNSTTRNKQVVKGACAAALGSAATLIQ